MPQPHALHHKNPAAPRQRTASGLREQLAVGQAVRLTQPARDYDYRMTFGPGTLGLVGAVRMPCVRYGSGFPFDEFVCVDLLVKRGDLTDAQVAEMRAHMDGNCYASGNVPPDIQDTVFTSHVRLMRDGVPYKLLRVAAPYDGLRTEEYHPDAAWLAQAITDDPLPAHQSRHGTYPYPWIAGLTPSEAQAHMARLTRPGARA